MGAKEAKARIKINKLLEAAGWRFFDDETGPANIQLEANVKLTKKKVDEFGENFEKTKNGFIDFLLLDENGKPFIVLEAKSEEHDPLVGKEQARNYAKSQFVKYVILSNGNIHYFWNIYKGNPQIIVSFPSCESVKGSKALNAVDKKSGIERNRLNDFGADTIARAFVSSMKYSSATLKTYINDAALSQNDILTRGEFTSLVVSVLGVSDISGENYKDVVRGKSYFDAILTAKNMGLAPGYVSGSFKPENEIYGNDAVNMLKAALKNKGKKVTALNDVYELMPIDKAVSNEIGLYAIDRLFEETR